MKSTTLSLVALGLVGFAPVGAQDAARPVLDEQAVQIPLPPVPSSVVDPQGGLPDEPEGPTLQVGDGGAVTSIPVQLDDTIPLPNDAAVAVGPDGDHVVSGPSGDPYFLGFAAGKHYPPAGELVDAELVQQAQAAYTDGRPAAETYAFVMFQRRMTPARTAELEALGVRFLGFHPHYTQKVALPVGAIDLVAAHPAVRWVGVARSWQRIHPDLAQILAAASPNQALEIYVNVFESDLGPASTSTSVGRYSLAEPDGGFTPVPQDPAGLPVVVMSNGWQQDALENLGVEVLEYVDSVRAFRARVLPPLVEELSTLDFVQFVERVVPITLAHDESTPMIASDYSRVHYDGATNAVAVAGVIDSGIDLGHSDLAGLAGVGWDYTGSTGGVFSDFCEHGSHVAGTIFGTGATTPSLKGNAPGLGRWGATGRIFIVKIFNDSCGSSGTPMATICNTVNKSFTDFGGNTTQRPHVLNNSWGSGPTSGGWIGSETDARILDDEVYTNGQVWVFAAHNHGPNASTVSLQGSAKNVLTVGNVVDYEDGTVGDPGHLWTSSGRGPCGDGRWKPNIVAPGRWIKSVNANSPGYSSKSGTSMASPHVAGVVSQMMDKNSWLRYQPHRAASMVMATAVTKDDQILTWPYDAHLDNYGTGRIEAYRTMWGSSDFGWTNWGFNAANTYHYADFSVGPNATRLIVCMTYHEPSCSAGASKALVNDYDLYLDFEPIDPLGNAGNWFNQQSAVDNTEIRILNNPPEGDYRWKLWPESVTGGARVSVTVSTVYGDTTPNGSLTLSASDTYIQPYENVDLTATVYNPDYVASAIFLDSSSSGDVLQASTVMLRDGSTADLLGNPHAGRDLLVGDLIKSWSRSATWTTHWPAEGAKLWSVNARSDNWVDRSSTVAVVVDGTPPAAVTTLTSTTHTPGVWSNDPNITFTWTTPPDNLSGVAGYGEFMSLGGPGAPSNILDLGTVTTYSTTLATHTSPWYWNIKPVDRSGNWNAGYTSIGGYYIDTVAPLGPSGLVSSTHAQGLLSCRGTVNMHWVAASDAHSGVSGYVGVWDSSPLTNPTASNNLGAGATSYSRYLGNGTWYFHLRARDSAGNLGATAHSGPYPINLNPASAYCTAKVNSMGCTPTAFPVGTPTISGGFQVVATNVLNNKNGLMFWGLTPGKIPFQGGTKCVKAPTKRTSLQNSGGNPPPNDCSGSYSYTWTQAYMLSKGLSVGDTVYAQFWSRDPASSSTTGLTDAVQFTICH